MWRRKRAGGAGVRGLPEPVQGAARHARQPSNTKADTGMRRADMRREAGSGRRTTPGRRWCVLKAGGRGPSVRLRKGKGAVGCCCRSGSGPIGFRSALFCHGHAHRITSSVEGNTMLGGVASASRALAVGNAEQAASRSKAADPGVLPSAGGITPC